MVDIISRNGIPMSIDGSILGFLGVVIPPVETTVLETLSSLPTGGNTSMSTANDKLSQTFKMPQALSSNFKLYIYSNTGGTPAFDIDLTIVGVDGDVSTGDPYETELIGSASNTLTIDSSTADGYFAFDFSGVTLQDSSTYAAVITPSNISNLTGWGWERSPGSSNLYTDGKGWFSFNAGTSWIDVSGLPLLDFAMKITHLV